MPVTSGTSTLPEDRTRSTVESRETSVPAPGRVSMTSPAGTSGEFSSMFEPAVRPASPIFCRASDSVSPSTSGTSTLSGPVDTIIVMRSPSDTCEPAAGSVSTTLPSSISSSAVISRPTTRPRPSR